MKNSKNNFTLTRSVSDLLQHNPAVRMIKLDTNNIQTFNPLDVLEDRVKPELFEKKLEGLLLFTEKYIGDELTHQEKVSMSKCYKTATFNYTRVPTFVELCAIIKIREQEGDEHLSRILNYYRNLI